jgi:hypothetical protein
MLVISTMPASVATSSSAWASSGCCITVARAGFCLLSPADSCKLSAPVSCCAESDTLPPSGWRWADTPFSCHPHRIPCLLFILLYRI